ncbi:MAG: acetyl-CoA carboxylase carboxyltransferase subunit alpha [Alphaproteobacteria bacterium]|nr:acetyl-CoA carboxylase carboxyltransferase subunit alpha [Alphaproteobacteria bacterium]MDP6811578.1 acetyl-CoA carboxylase carboxyltransferase subunit alpha [Alphaproteobacteria bacterium]
MSFLDFEKPIAELESKIHELRQLGGDGEANLEIDIDEEVGRLQAKADQLLRETYDRLTPWQKVQVARHPNRPQFNDYVSALIDDFTPLSGDRAFADDKAVAGGIGRFQGRSVMVIGHEKGTDTQSRVRHNFGMARPEGYRKAARLMRLADRFGLAVITLVDTQGAYPGIGAEERGQAEAIARSTETCLDIRVPLIACIVGEGGSGGAVALATGNSVIMLEHAVYSVISPEGCASILWHSAERAQEAAEAMKLTAQDLSELKVVDKVVEESIGGAHRNPASTVAALGEAIAEALAGFDDSDGGQLRHHRREKFLEMGGAGIA